jgi:predicted metal-binding membrane protein
MTGAQVTAHGHDVRPVAAAAATLALAAAAWVVALRRMDGMDMGVATELGSPGFFLAAWVPMMAAMMLPGALPAISRSVRADGRRRGAAWFVVSYLAVWAAVGLAVFVLYRPHGTVAAGVLTIAAGAYEFTPFKRESRRRCRHVHSGLALGRYCVGSSIGLMAVLLALGAMSITWMAVVAVVVLGQKLLPPAPALDLPVALALIVLGIVVIVDPGSIPGVTPTM